MRSAAAISGNSSTNVALPPGLRRTRRFDDAHLRDRRAGIRPLGQPRPIVLMGHRDTVFPKGEVGRRPFRIEGGRAYGPGVVDMKSGLVMNCFVLTAIKKFGGAPAPVTALFTGDEEIGSPFSRPVIERHARAARVCFNSEPGRARGAAVTGRKGCLFMRFEITGKPRIRRQLREGHQRHRRAGAQDARAACAKRSAERRHPQRRRDFGRADRQHRCALGEGEVDLRFITPAQRDATLAKVEAIMAKSYVPGTSAKLEITGEFLPLVETGEGKALYEHYAAGLKELGVAETTRCSPAAAPIPGSQRRPAYRPSAASVRSAGASIRPTSTWRSKRWCRAHRRWRWRCCGCPRRPSARFPGPCSIRRKYPAAVTNCA